MMRPVQSYLTRLYAGLRGTPAMQQSFLPAQPPSESRHGELYHLLDLYYQQNALYDSLRMLAYSTLGKDGATGGAEHLVGLRNPVRRCVEVYADHLWPGTLPDALPIETDLDGLDDAIRELHRRSNFGTQKQIIARWTPLYGESYLRVQTDERRSTAWFDLYRPHYVPDVETVRGDVTYLRLDFPTTERDRDGVKRERTRTEVWDTTDFRCWTKEGPPQPGGDLKSLGTPDEERTLASMGLDFIPWVRVVHVDTGDTRGTSAVLHAIDKIDESSRMATALHERFFRYGAAMWAIETAGMDSNGRPLAAAKAPPGGVVKMGPDELHMLGNGQKLVSLVPDIPFADGLEILLSHLREVGDDLPELDFYRAKELGNDLSGRAMRLFLSNAVARVLEARGNAESALIRADIMALRMAGPGLGYRPASQPVPDRAAPPFPGTEAEAERADAEAVVRANDAPYLHHIGKREVVPLTDSEEAEAFNATTDLSLLERYRRMHYTDDEARAILAERNQDLARAAEIEVNSDDGAKTRAETAVLRKQYGYSDEALMREDGLTDSDIARIQGENTTAAQRANSLGDTMLTQFAAGNGGGQGQPQDGQQPRGAPPNTPPTT